MAVLSAELGIEASINIYFNWMRLRPVRYPVYLSLQNSSSMAELQRRTIELMMELTMSRGLMPRRFCFISFRPEDSRGLG